MATPEPNNKYYQVDFDKLNESIGAKVKKCPICGHEDFSADTSILSLQAIKNNRKLAPAIMPVLAILCDNCGHLMLFNAITTGFFSPAPEASPQTNDQGDDT